MAETQLEVETIGEQIIAEQVSKLLRTLGTLRYCKRADNDILVGSYPIEVKSYWMTEDVIRIDISSSPDGLASLRL